MKIVFKNAQLLNIDTISIVNKTSDKVGKQFKNGHSLTEKLKKLNIKSLDCILLILLETIS